MDKPTLPQYLSQLNDIAEVAKAYGEAMATWGAAQERRALLDCRTCQNFTKRSGGCMSTAQCIDGSQYRASAPARYWAQQGD